MKGGLTMSKTLKFALLTFIAFYQTASIAMEQAPKRLSIEAPSNTKPSQQNSPILASQPQNEATPPYFSHALYEMAHSSDSMAAFFISHYIERGANPNASDQDGTTALHSAVRASNLPVVELLVGAGAKVNSKSTSLGTPLALAKEQQGNKQANQTKIIELLVAKGATCDNPQTKP